MAKQEKLDVHLGPLRALLEADAAATGKAPGALLRESYQLWRLGQSMLADQVRDAVLALHAAQQPDERFDPADDPRPGAALSTLTQLLGSAYAAAGIAAALEALSRHVDD